MRKALLAISVIFSAAVWSQTACFTYDDDEQTIISGTTFDAIYQGEEMLHSPETTACQINLFLFHTLAVYDKDIAIFIKFAR